MKFFDVSVEEFVEDLKKDLDAFRSNIVHLRNKDRFNNNSARWWMECYLTWTEWDTDQKDECWPEELDHDF